MYNLTAYNLFAPYFILVSLLLVFPQTLIAGEIRVAVASNFTSTMKLLAAQYKQQTGNKVILAAGSTGKHFAQISNGAPFDAFFAADTRHPALLETKELAIPDTRFTYAIGRLVLWSKDENFIDNTDNILESGNFTRLAIANPKLAPYGMAAQQALKAKGLWTQLQDRIVRGENIAQTLQFIRSGNAQLGFVALSQIQQLHPKAKGSYWIVDPLLYDPIQQQAILLKDKPEARLLLKFVKSNAGRAIIKRNGYDLP